MNEIKQILRWTIPGWIFITVIFLFFALIRLAIPINQFINYNLLHFHGLNNAPLKEIWNLFDNVITKQNWAIIGSIFALGVPFGYIISQFYYRYTYKYDNLFTICPKFNEFFNDETIKHFNEILGLKLNENNYEIKFASLYFYLNSKLKNDSNENLKRERTLSDLSHSLGATFFAIIFAFIISNFFLITFIIIKYNPIALMSIIPFLLIYRSILLPIIWVVYKNRMSIAIHQAFILTILLEELGINHPNDKIGKPT